jgi:poly(ADP-ribose) glycohydrolase ARH3
MSLAPASDQFHGCLLGLAMGDALGAPFEGLPDGVIDGLCRSGVALDDPGDETIHYTDDTQMMIGVAETLADRCEIDEAALLANFAANYHPDRGYGPGMRILLEAISEGRGDRDLALNLFPGGSLGNGAAMRVAPVGLFFAEDLDRVAEQAERSARTTHLHPIGIDGARLMAVAVALAARRGPIRRKEFFGELARWAETEEFQWQLNAAAQLRSSDSLGTFGNSLEAHRSVTTAIAIFVASPDDYSRVIRRAIGQGNDTDTLAAMAGALAGTRLGVGAVPEPLLARLEDGHKGRRYITSLADRLCQRLAHGRGAPDMR